MLLSFFLGGFFLWKTLKDSYPDEEILTLSIWMGILTLVASLGWRYWSVGGTLAIPLVWAWLWGTRLKWDRWELFDALGQVGVLVGSFLAFSWGFELWLAGSLLFLGSLILWWVKANFRHFSWYKSGRPGFVGVTSIVVFMVVWLGIANWHPTGIYLGGLAIEQWVAVWIIIASLTALYIRGERRVTQDWKKVTKLWPNLKK